MRVLVVYSTFDGQTARIAERMAEGLRKSGHQAVVREVQKAPALVDCDAVLVGGAIRYGHHSKALVKWVRAHVQGLDSRPNAFFSVCMSAGGPGARPKTAQEYLDRFESQTGWKPRIARSFAGACYYTRYNFFIRTMMKLIMTIAGGETDTSRNFEYTDWNEVERFAGRFCTAAAVA